MLHNNCIASSMDFPGPLKFHELVDFSDDIGLPEFMVEHGERLPLLAFIEEGYYGLDCDDNGKILCKAFWISGKSAEKRVLCRDVKRKTIFTIPADLPIQVSCIKKSKGVEKLPLSELLKTVKLPSTCSVDDVDQGISVVRTRFPYVGDVVEFCYIYEENYFIGHAFLGGRPVMELEPIGVLLSCPVTIKACTGVKWDAEERTTSGLTQALQTALKSFSLAEFRLPPRRVSYKTDKVPELVTYNKCVTIPKQATLHEYHSLSRVHHSQRDKKISSGLVNLASIALEMEDVRGSKRIQPMEYDRVALQKLFPSVVPVYEDLESNDYEDPPQFPPPYKDVVPKPQSDSDISDKCPEPSKDIHKMKKEWTSSEIPAAKAADNPSPIRRAPPPLPDQPKPLPKPKPKPLATPPSPMPMLPTKKEEILDLSVNQVGQCLMLLNMESYREKFVEEQIDGGLLYTLTDDILSKHFGMASLHIIKLQRFLSGHPPKL